ncbi:MAG: AAA family ATPase [Desulfobacca sp.]|nr:AAA family ATPase [Desulfobacca sp.]
MYNDYFGFSNSPFENNLDQRFLFLSEDHQEVLAALLYFVKERKGLAIVCGDVGTGKTMLVNSFLNRLPDSVQSILISNPMASYLDLLHFIAAAIGIVDKKENVLELLDQIKEVLIADRQQGKDYILIVDEAHLFPDASLEEVRLLSNIEVPESKLLQILLVGQYELSHNLNRPQMRQLRQRINISRFLSPLNQTETIAYIDHRLQQVGSSFPAIFEPKCEKLLYQLTDGVPRRINQLCDNALLSCMADGLRRVNRQVLKKAHEALLTDVIFTPKASVKPWKNMALWIPLTASAAFLIIGLFLGQTGWWGQYFRPDPGQTRLESKIPSVSAPLPATSKPAKPDNVLSVPGKKVEQSADKPAYEPQSKGAEVQVSKDENEGQSTIASAAPGPTGSLARAELSRPEFSSRPGSAATDSSSSPPTVSQDTSKAAPETISAGDTGVKSTVSDSTTVNFPEPIKVRANDNLTKIASTHYPDDVDLGLEAILLANPETTNEDLIYPGQKLNLPLINPADQTIILREHLFYGAYGRYFSMSSLQKTLSWLSQQGVRYLVVNTKTYQGGITHRVLIGGYENRQDLDKALQRLKARSG